MKLNKEKITKTGGIYATAKLSIKSLLDALDEGKVRVPIEQRKMEAKDKKYKQKAERFIAYLLINAFQSSDTCESARKDLEKVFGADIEIVNGIPQLIGLSIDEDGVIYLSDGQHRFLNYLKDFKDGVLIIKNGTDFGGDFINERMDDIFNAIEFEDGDGASEKDKVIAISIFEQEDLDIILDMKLTASIVKSEDFDERAYQFLSMNSTTAISTNDLDRAAYVQYPMWDAIEKVHNSLRSITKDEGICFTKGKIYDVYEAQELRALLNCRFSTFVPMIAHMGLLTFLPKDMIKDYQWLYKGQKQPEQTRNFFKATENMTTEECNQYLMNIMDAVLEVADVCYDHELEEMQAANKARSLLVGQLEAFHSLRNSVIPEETFDQLANEITYKVLFDGGYRPIGKSKNDKAYDISKFNNAHHNRKNNELFSVWMKEESALKEGAK